MPSGNGSQAECNMWWSCGGGLDAGVVKRHVEVQIEWESVEDWTLQARDEVVI